MDCAFAIKPLYIHIAMIRSEQSADEVEQGRLACAIFAQQAINIVSLDVKAEICENVALSTRVLKADVLYLYHILLTLWFLMLCFLTLCFLHL